MIFFFIRTNEEGQTWLIYKYVILPFLDSMFHRHHSFVLVCLFYQLKIIILNLLYVLTLILGRWADLMIFKMINKQSNAESHWAC